MSGQDLFETTRTVASMFTGPINERVVIIIVSPSVLSLTSAKTGIFSYIDMFLDEGVLSPSGTSDEVLLDFLAMAGMEVTHHHPNSGGPTWCSNKCDSLDLTTSVSRSDIVSA